MITNLIKHFVVPTVHTAIYSMFNKTNRRLKVIYRNTRRTYTAFVRYTKTINNSVGITRVTTAVRFLKYTPKKKKT